MAQVKGILILGLIKFMKKGMREAMPQIMSTLPPETKKYMEEHILPAGWYPYRVLPDLLRTVDKILGKGDLSYCIEQGRLSAQRDLSTIFKSFISNTNPKILITTAMSIWSSYYDVGKADMSVLSDNEAVVIIKDFSDIDMAHVKSTQGWLEQFLRMCKYEDVKSEIVKCQCNGDTVTELRFKFKSQGK